MTELSIQETDRILVVAPHPDDETLGCGGLIAKYSKQCDVLVVTDGCLGNPEWDEKKTVITRYHEITNCMNLVGVNKLLFSNFKDSSLKGSEHLDISSFEYDYVFIPNHKDNHPDHIAVNKMVRRSIKNKHCQVLEYEVWTPLSDVSDYIVIDGLKKKKMIASYECQLKHVNYFKMLDLNSYRGMQLGHDFCEVFYRKKKIKKTCRFTNGLKSFLYRVGLIQ